MSKEARQQKRAFSPQLAEKMCELAALIAQEEYGEERRPPLETTFPEIEEIGHQADQLPAGVIDQQFTATHGEHFADCQPCPQCGRLGSSASQAREFTTRDGPIELSETACHCPMCRRDFSPQRVKLKLDGHAFNPSVLAKILVTAGAVPSHAVAAKVLEVVGELSISSRQINKLTNQVGGELEASRDQQTEAYFATLATHPNACRAKPSVGMRRGRWWKNANPHGQAGFGRACGPLARDEKRRLFPHGNGFAR